MYIHTYIYIYPHSVITTMVYIQWYVYRYYKNRQRLKFNYLCKTTLHTRQKDIIWEHII